MNNAELIEALRYCGGEEKYCKLCPSYDTCHAEVDGLKQILLAAADVLEAQQKRIADLETALSACRAQRGQMPKEGEWMVKYEAIVPATERSE